jgi:hypothetical protein
VVRRLGSSQRFAAREFPKLVAGELAARTFVVIHRYRLFARTLIGGCAPPYLYTVSRAHSHVTATKKVAP